MFLTPTPRRNRFPKRFGIQFFAAIFCCIVLCLLVAATIVLALIPLYLTNHSVNTKMSTTKMITMTIQVEQNSTRRRRAADDLVPYVGADLANDTYPDIESQLLSYLPSSQVTKVTVSSAVIAYQNSAQIGKRKRYALSKRSLPTGYIVVLVLNFVLTYASTCVSTCQTAAEPILRSSLLAVASQTFVITDVPIILNGVSLSIPRVQFITVTYISAIIPSTNVATSYVTAITATVPSNTTTTAATTPAVNG